jgi:hypothetical protein
MKKKIILSVFVAVFCITVNVSAQKNFNQNRGYTPQLETNSKRNEKFSFPEIEKFDGTYQFIIKHKTDFLITSETFDLIEENRKETEDVTITLSDYLDVFIYSKNSIKQAGFVPYKSSYILK